MKTLIISGKAGSGKDSLAEFMREILKKNDKRVIVIHYADAVKWVLRDFFDWDGQKDEHGRHLLQYIGTDVVRKNYPNYWVGIVAGLLSAFEAENLFDVALIPDARFPNEVEVVEDTIGPATLIRVDRKNLDGTPWINDKLTKEQREHASETSLDSYGFDYIVHNDEGLELLKESAETLLQDLKII